MEYSASLEHTAVSRMASLPKWELDKAIRAGKVAFFAFVTNCDSRYLIKRARQLRKDLIVMGHIQANHGDFVD